MQQVYNQNVIPLNQSLSLKGKVRNGMLRRENGAGFQTGSLAVAAMTIVNQVSLHYTLLP